MEESCVKALGRRLFQVPEYAVNTADVSTRVTLDDAMRAPPPLLVSDEPGALLGCE
jgi:hypothetical protein